MIDNLVAVATVGANFKRLREGAGYATAAAFIVAARERGIELSASQVSDFENDRYGLPDTKKLLRFATVIPCLIDELLKDVDSDYQQALAQRALTVATDDVDEGRLDVSGHTREDIPVIAEGEASPQGNLFWSEEGRLSSDVEDRISRPFDVRDPRAYGVRVRGDSMAPIYRAKMVLVVSPNTPVADGDEVYVELLSGERLIKIARRAPGGWILESANPSYAARFVAAGDIGAMHPIVWSKRKPSGQRVVNDRRGASDSSAPAISERSLAIARQLDRLGDESVTATIESTITEFEASETQDAAATPPRPVARPTEKKS